MLLLQPGPHRFGYNSSVFLPLSISSYQSQTTNYTALSYANVPDTKVHIPYNIPGIFLQAFVVLSRLFHILHQEDNTVRYWSDRTEYAGCFSRWNLLFVTAGFPFKALDSIFSFQKITVKSSIQAVPLKPFLFSFLNGIRGSFLRLFNKIPRLGIRFLLLFLLKKPFPSHLQQSLQTAFFFTPPVNFIKQFCYIIQHIFLDIRKTSVISTCSAAAFSIISNNNLRSGNRR